MSKAASPSSKLTRRKAIAATLAGIAAPALAGPAPLTPDPVSAAIAAHKAAYARLDQACLQVARLEENIPGDRRQEWFEEDRGQGIGTNDDPRWTAALRRSGLHSAPKRKRRGPWRTRDRRGSPARRPCCAMPASSRQAAADGPAIRKMTTATNRPSYSTIAWQRHWRL